MRLESCVSNPRRVESQRGCFLSLEKIETDRFGKLLSRRSFNFEKGECSENGFPLNRFTKTFERVKSSEEGGGKFV